MIQDMNAKFIFLRISNCSTIFVKKIIVPSLNLICTLSKTKCPYIHGTVQCSSCPADLFSYLSINNTTVSDQCGFGMISAAIGLCSFLQHCFYFFKVVLVVLGPFDPQLNLRMNLSMSKEKQPAHIFIRISLNLQVNQKALTAEHYCPPTQERVHLTIYLGIIHFSH